MKRRRALLHANVLARRRNKSGKTPPNNPDNFAPIKLPIKGLQVIIYAKTNVVKGLLVYPNDIMYFTSQN